MSGEVLQNYSYEIVASAPTVVNITAEDFLDKSNGFYFREWTHPDRQCYRWSGACSEAKIPIRIDRSIGNRITITIMNEMCDPSDIWLSIDGESVAITEDRNEYYKLITASVKPSTRKALVLGLGSAMRAEGTHETARSLGLAIIDISIISETA